MRRIPAEPLTPLAPFSCWMGLTALVLALTALGSIRFGGVPPANGYIVLGAAVLCGGLALVFAVAALGAVWRYGGPGFGPAIKGLCLGFAVLAAPAYFGALAIILPMINDVTTDVQDPPSFGRSRASVEARGGHIPQEYNGQTVQDQQDAYPAVRPIILDQTAEEAMALALRAATNLGWRVIDSTPPSGRTSTGRIEATVRSLIFGLTDDITVRIRPGINEARIDLRSTSRFGRHDFGANARRIQAFQQEIEALSAQR